MILIKTNKEINKTGNVTVKLLPQNATIELLPYLKIKRKINRFNWSSTAAQTLAQVQDLNTPYILKSPTNLSVHKVTNLLPHSFSNNRM